MAKRSEEEEKRLATPGAPTDLAPRPAYIEDSNEGLEGLRKQDLLWPRMRLIQSTSEDVKKREASAGQVLIDLTKQVVADVGKEVDIIPIVHSISWIEWNETMGEGIIDSSRDPKSELAMRCAAGETREDGRLAVTEYHDFLVLLPGVSDPAGGPMVATLSFKGTSHKVGRKLLMLAKMRKSALYSGVYALSSQQVAKGGNSWYEYTIDNSVTQQGWATPEQFAQAKQLWAEFGQEFTSLDPAKLAEAEDGARGARQTEGEFGKSDKY